MNFLKDTIVISIALKPYYRRFSFSWIVMNYDRKFFLYLISMSSLKEIPKRKHLF